MATKVSKKKAETVTEVTATEKPEVKKKTAAKKTTTRKKTTAKAAAKTAKKTTVSKKAKTEARKTEINNYPNAYLIVDHPIDMETIYGNHYAIRIGASADGYVEISFNNGEWQPCRYDAGYWWFDWTYFSPGHYEIKTRLVDTNGNSILETSPRKCRIC